MEISQFLDHTLLKPDATANDIEQLCKEAKTYRFYSVCIPPYYVERASKLLKGSSVKITTVVGFPMGYSSISAKVEEIKRAIQKGADEIDAVVNISAVKSADWKYLKNEISSLVGATHLQRKVFKLILETSLLDSVEIAQLCAISSDTGVDFVKNATGFNGKGATIEMMQFLRTSLPDNIQIKASGGIRTLEFAQALIAEGVTRIGSSSSVAIMEGQQLVGS